MARDSQAALVALNRFGFGARGGASGDLVNAASDPRGFVKAELVVPTACCWRRRACSPRRSSAQAVFAYQDQVKQAREAAAKGGRADREAIARRPIRSRAAPQSLAERRRDRDRRPDGRGKQPTSAADKRRKPDTMQPNAAAPPAAKPPPQPLNVIQKTFRAEALARLQRATRRVRLRRAAGGVLVQPFLHLRQQGRAGADLGRRVRARGDPAACARTLRRHAEGGRAASGDAVLSRQPAIARAGFPRRAEPQARAERKSRARDHGAAYARRRRRLHAGRRHLARAHHHRLDLCRTAGAARRARQLRRSTPMRTSPGAQTAARQGLRGRRPRAGRSRARRHRAPSLDREIHRHQIRPPFRGRRSAAGAGGAAAATSSSRPTAISRRWRRRWSIPTRPGRRR